MTHGAEGFPFSSTTPNWTAGATIAGGPGLMSGGVDTTRWATSGVVRSNEPGRKRAAARRDLVMDECPVVSGEHGDVNEKAG